LAMVVAACAGLRIPSRCRSLNRLRVGVVLTGQEELASEVERVYFGHSSGTVAARNVQYRDCLVNLAIGNRKQ
jgi:hypothetical protein